jgi:hypothetical protein
MLPRAKLERVLGLMVKRSLFLREQEAQEEEELMKSYPEAHEVDIFRMHLHLHSFPSSVQC